MSAAILPLRLPTPQPCHACRERTGAIYKFVGTVCPICKTERPAFTAFKAMCNDAMKKLGVEPITNPLPPCRYEPKALCDCGGRGFCLDAA